MEICPKCIGTGEVFNPVEDELDTCDYCKGKGKVSTEEYDNYDPLKEEDYEEI